MASSPNDTLVVETTDAICRITLNRPKSLNAINPDMARALKQVAAEIKADKAVRVAVIQGAGDHFMAGGDVKGGSKAGETDEFSLRSVGEPIHMRDVHATILNLMGLEDERLTYLYAGRNRRLTDIGGKTLEEIIS